jgi:hypothetical protein
VGSFVYLVGQNRRWKETASGLAQSEGIHVAKEDFRAGRLQLYIPINEFENSFGGSNYGSYKVLPLSAHPFDDQGWHVAAQFAEGYNRRMKAIHEHPDRYIAETNAEGRVEWK